MKTKFLKPNATLKQFFARCYDLKQKWAITLGLTAAAVLLPAITSAQTAWTGTWGVTPQSGGQNFNQQTIRQIVFTSVGGSTARIRLSNLFGSQTVSISDVHIALAGAGSSIQAGTDHVVTFGGSSSVTIGAGAEVNSDSIPMTIPSLSEVAISFYLPNSTNVQTYHQFSFQTVYVANGDVSGSTNLSVASTLSSYFYLTNLDVQSSTLTGAVVTFGASITDGYTSTQNANHRWPNFLAQRLSAAGINVGVINQGVSGNQLLNNNNSLSALNRFQHDAVGQPNVRWVIFSDDPINDVGNNSSITGAQLIAGVKQLIAQAHSNGLKFLGSTLTPFHGSGGWTTAGETAREQYDAFIISPSSGCDGVIDQDAATHDPSNPTQYLPAYDSGDHLHPNDAGYQAIANAVNLSFFGTPTESPFGGTAAAIPGTIQNENYDTGGEGLAYNVTSINGTGNSYRSDGVDLETTADTGGGFDLGWTSSGQWFKYTVNVASAGAYTASFRVAALTAVGTNAGSFHLQTSSGTNLSGAINVPGTGGWQTWTTITANVTLPAGQQIIELFEDTGGYNLNSMAFTPSANQAVVVIRAMANNQFVTAANSTTSLIASSSTSSSPAQQFDVINLGNGNIALRAHSDGLYVTAENAGASPLIANRTAIGSWETFQEAAVSGGVSLKAMANGMFVTADNAGASPLIANRTAVGPWETFVFETPGSTPPVAAPAFSPGSGSYTSAQNVTITTATGGASIRYTTDGSMPSETAGTIYSGPINISSTATLKAIAYESGFSDSTITSGTYTINILVVVAAPAFSPGSGSYTGAQNVTITTATGGASIRYTTDGSTPSETAGTIYSGPINISSSTTLNAIAYESGFTDSNVASASYTINTPPPSVVVGATTPFVSYEAEAGTPGGGATVVSLTSPPTTQFSSPTLEASGHAYVQLTATGQFVQWTNNTGQNITALNLRSCIPDAPTGGGIVSTIDLYVDGVFRQSFGVNSQQNYCYEGLSYNDQTNKSPSAGDPRFFWNDTHAFITGAPVAPGSTIRFQKDSENTAAFYYIDVIDVENPPPALTQPANSLSLTSFGAVANNSAIDNTSAINNCFSAAQSQGKIAWIPTGIFYFSAIHGGLNASGIIIEGAGPWYSTLYRVTPANNTQGIANIITATSSILENVSLDCNGASRAGNNNNGAVDFSGSNWLVNNVWIQHVTSSFWCAGDNGMAENCRTLSVWSDGGNFNNVQDSRGIGTSLTYFNNFVRGTGDDAMAINSVNFNGSTFYTMMSNITYENNTAVAPWGGKCIGIYGGSNVTVKNNLLSDTARYLGLGVMKFGVNGSNLLSATVTGNTVLRCGGNGFNQQQQAVMIGNGGDGQGVGTVENAYVGSNTITNALYDAVGFSSSINVVLHDNIINAPGLDGIAFGNRTIDLGTVTGDAILLNNTVNNLNPGRTAVATQSGTGYTVYTPILAASFSGSSGVQTENCAEGGLDVGFISNGSSTFYNQLKLTGVVTFVARVASAGSGGNIEVHLDSPTGTLIGTSVVPVTGGWQTWTDTQCSISGASGTHNVYLVYTGGSGNLFNVQWFSLTQTPSI